ncbi:hypothetical protein C9374_007722 [Naegleria lovaniensis]|uniref:Peptidase M14 domain-containing protein n=1 Tax=Naegleria lovaniensis TaxID=51637 RepID=A0AA88GKB0_NAELO|nr:uncharacterized protein C9374_007722 [Naegleria lovaniensis]KAG2379084.1 hypothetical protein C9374_007722 [Naegleria lovaniensis]
MHKHMKSLPSSVSIALLVATLLCCFCIVLVISEQPKSISIHDKAYSLLVMGLSRNELKRLALEGRHAPLDNNHKQQQVNIEPFGTNDDFMNRIRDLSSSHFHEQLFAQLVSQFQKEMFTIQFETLKQVERMEQQVHENNYERKKQGLVLAMTRRLFGHEENFESSTTSSATTTSATPTDSTTTKTTIATASTTTKTTTTRTARMTHHSSSNTTTTTSPKLRNHNYVEMTAKMREIHLSFPNMTQMYSVGHSVQQRELWVMKITSNKVIGAPPYSFNLKYRKPKFKYVANMHGNETVGREVILYFIEYLLNLYKNGDLMVTRILDYMDVYIMPSMNPDGYELKQRRNANGVDLNRNFIDYYFGMPDDPFQPETLSIMQWISQEQFILSANLHGGVLVANYPFDTALQKDANYSATPDDTFFRMVASVYANANPEMRLSKRFPGGITNGAAWWVVHHTMADYNYFAANCYELTLELTEEYIAPESDLDKFWEQNKLSLILYMDQMKFSAVGIVADEMGNGVSFANVTVKGNAKIITSNYDGFFWRLLPPGNYTIEVSKKGYISQSQNVIIPENAELGKPVFAYFILKKVPPPPAPSGSVPHHSFESQFNLRKY